MSESGPTAGGVTPLEQAAIRKLIYSLDPVEDNLDDSLVDSVNRIIERIEKLESQTADVALGLEQVEGVVVNGDWEQMTAEAKDIRVAQSLVGKAERQNGRAAFHYDEVLAVHENVPSAGTAYNIMERVGEREGFDYQSGHETGKRLTVNLKGVDPVFRAE